MLTTLAIANYRSLRNLIVPLQRLNLITGPNGSGKSSVYRALRLLAETAQGGVIPSLAAKADCNQLSGPDRKTSDARLSAANKKSKAQCARNAQTCDSVSPVMTSAMRSISDFQPKPIGVCSRSGDQN